MPPLWHYNRRRLWETTHFIYFCANTKKLLTCYRFRTIIGAAAPKNWERLTYWKQTYFFVLTPHRLDTSLSHWRPRAKILTGLVCRRLLILAHTFFIVSATHVLDTSLSHWRPRAKNPCKNKDLGRFCNVSRETIDASEFWRSPHVSRETRKKLARVLPYYFSPNANINSRKKFSIPAFLLL